MSLDSRDENSHLFMLRLWQVRAGDGQARWRSKAQHVPSGATCYLDDLPALVDLLVAALVAPGDEGRKTKDEVAVVAEIAAIDEQEAGDDNNKL